MKRKLFSLFGHEFVPYLLSCFPGSHAIFFRSLISSNPSKRSGSLCANEDEPLSIYSSPLHIWVDQACGYHFRRDFLDDQACSFSFQDDLLPPTHLHQFIFMIDYMSIHVHDY
jgi:hypothetical protein